MEGDIDIRALFGLLRRHIRLIIVTVVAIMGIAALVTFTMTPVYTATTLVMVDPSNKNLLTPESQFSTASGDNARVDGEVELVRSPNVLLSVIDSEKLTTDPEFQPSLGFTSRILSFLRIREPKLPTAKEALGQSLARFRSTISVQRRGLTYLIAINVRSEEPAKAARLANAVADSYIQSQLRSKVESALKSRDVLQSQIGSARNAIVTSEGSFDTFLNANLQHIVDETGDPRLKQLQTQIGELSTLRQKTADDIAAAEASLKVEDYDTLAKRLAGEALQNLDQQRRDILGELETGAGQSLSSIDLRSRLADIEGQIDLKANAALTDMRKQITTSHEQESELRNTIRSTVLDSNLSADVLTQIYDLQQNAEIARRQYDTLLARSQDLEAQASLQIADSRVVSPALEPANASWPNTPVILLLAALGALAIGVGLAFLYDNFLGGIVSEDQAQSVLHTKNALTVPRQKLTHADQLSLSDNLVTAPLSIFAESIRRVRAALDQSTRPTQADEPSGKVVMVTSTAPGEGKTTVALSIARSYSLSGQRVLLVDCDLRRPNIHRQLGVEASKGLLDFLTHKGENEDIRGIMTIDSLTGLTSIVGSRRSDIPTDQLIAGKTFKHLITAARGNFDIVVLDTPPIGPVVDAMYVAPFADAILFVVRWASTPQADVRKAVATIAASKHDNSNLLVVLNQQEVSSIAYYGKYGSYYTDEG